MRKLLGCVWLEAMGDTQFHLFQTDCLRKTDASHFARRFCPRESKRAREGVEDAFVSGTVGPQEGLWPHPALLRVHSAKQRGIRAVARGAQQMVGPERGCSQLGSSHQRHTHFLPARSHQQFSWLFPDHVLGGLDEHLLHADDICPLASSKKDLERMVKECTAGFQAAGLETGLDKTFWTSIVRSPTASRNIDGHSI